MFKNKYAGALAVMDYYFKAVNWDAATGATPTIYKSFCPKACDQEVKYSLQRNARHEHYEGGRYISGSAIIVPNPKGSGATWGGQYHVTVTRGKILGANGQLVSSFEKSVVGMELDVKFNGTLWNVVGIYFVG